MNNCPICHKQINEDYELNTCNECDIEACIDCMTKDHFECHGGFEYCDDTDYHCNKYKLECKNCHEDICANHVRDCKECGQEGCEGCMITHYKYCLTCHIYSGCANDWETCGRCHDFKMCPIHIYKCDGCGKTKCFKCMVRCMTCDKIFCCYQTDKCEISKEHFQSGDHRLSFQVETSEEVRRYFAKT